jgi:hypothetical protein
MTGKDIAIMTLWRPFELNFTQPIVFLLNLYIVSSSCHVFAVHAETQSPTEFHLHDSLFVVRSFPSHLLGNIWMEPRYQRSPIPCPFGRIRDRLHRLLYMAQVLLDQEVRQPQWQDRAGGTFAPRLCSGILLSDLSHLCWMDGREDALDCACDLQRFLWRRYVLN